MQLSFEQTLACIIQKKNLFDLHKRTDSLCPTGANVKLITGQEDVPVDAKRKIDNRLPRRSAISRVPVKNIINKTKSIRSCSNKKSVITEGGKKDLTNI